MPFSFGIAHQFTYSAAAQVFSQRYLLQQTRGTTDMEDGATREATTTNIYPPVKVPSSSSSTCRPHRCEICQRSFREIATLRKHEQLHRADRPYVCQTCGKSFLWSSNLKVHERVHTGERPYKCKICHRCFTQSNDLRRHERNVHMRGKLYGYKQGVGMGRGGVVGPPGGAGGGGSHVNLAAYQAFAMQQRALLQQALTYESYLHTAASVTQGQMFAQPPPPLMQANKEGSMALCLPPGGGVVGAGMGGVPPRGLEDGGHGRRDGQQRSPVKLEQVTPPPNSTPGEGGGGGGGVGEGVMVEKRGGVVMGGADPHGGVVGVVSLQHSPLSPRFLPSSTCPPGGVPPLPGPVPHHHHLPSPMHRSPPMLLAVGRGGGASYPQAPGGGKNNHPHSPLQSPASSHHHLPSPPAGAGGRAPALPSFSSFCHPHHPHSSTADYEDSDPHAPGTAPSTPTPSSSSSLHLAMSRPPSSSTHPHSHLHHHHHHNPHHPHHHHHHHRGVGGHNNNSNNQGDDADEDDEMAGRDSAGSGGGASKDKYPCDSVMDLSMNKTPPDSHLNHHNLNNNNTPSRPASGSEKDGALGHNNHHHHHHHHHSNNNGGSNAEAGGGNDSTMPPPKTPSSGSECGEGKRDVSTTSATPLAAAADNGIHHCQHCNIFFYDYTMYHLHESLHMPYEDYPFRCPSCGKHCQDRIEFMFHTVWHVKYPHTIPNYEPFKDNFISS